MKLLSIETSCDDTGISILEVRGSATRASFKVLADNTSSQINIHQPYGGVYPMLAKREHIKNLPIVLEKTLREAGDSGKRTSAQRDGASKANFQQKIMRGESGRNSRGALVDAIAVTYGPGLEPSLWAGITFARELAEKWSVPLIPVNHMEGHVLSVFAKDKGKFDIALTKDKFPMLALLVSGGHTQLVLSKSPLHYEIIGATLDDAVGEAFDKVARMMDLPYPGGPEISKLAERIRGSQNYANGRSATGARTKQFSSKKSAGEQNVDFPFAFPRPMLKSKDFNFSFAGLKTSVLYTIQRIKKLDEKTKAEIALEFENAAIECLVYKTAKALEKYKVKTLIVAGGVAANKKLRKDIRKLNKKALFPTQYLSGDNALMIGIAGYFQYLKNKNRLPRPATIKATGNLKL